MPLDDVLDGLVSVRSQIAADALTAPILGLEREGHGVVISEQGLVLTIGYVVTEAESLWILDNKGLAVPGHLLAYDQVSGFGLVQALGKLSAPVIELGNSADLEVGQSMVLAGSGGPESVIEVTVREIREFAGYWEYLIDGAIFTGPAHPDWGGTALLGSDRKLYGIGSLILQREGDEDKDLNMIIPIDLYKEIAPELLNYGNRTSPARPWLGWYVQNSMEGPIVLGTVDGAPAQLAGIEAGDVVVAVNGKRVSSINDAFRSIWGAGEAGVSVNVAIRREEELQIVPVQSVDRGAMLWRAPLH